MTLDDYVGQKLNYAQRRLSAAGLSVSVVKQDVSNSSQNGIVLSQAPTAGTHLSPGDRVTLTVGDYKKPDNTTSSTTSSTTTPRPQP